MVSTIPHSSRVRLLADDYRAFRAGLGIPSRSGQRLALETPETLVPHPHLRLSLQSDPAMGALLPGSPCHMALGRQKDLPFRLKAPDLLLLAPSLLDSVRALSAAARWGMEAAFARQIGEPGPSGLAALLRHGRSLLAPLLADDRALLLGSASDVVERGLFAASLEEPGPEVLAWMAELAGVERVPMASTAEPRVGIPLEGPIEDILLSNGDSRIRVNPGTGKNRYGTTVRPRPEAVHFSSSTASSISEYGFLFCDLMRRDLRGHMERTGLGASEVRARLSDAVVQELCRLCGLGPEEADGVLAPSGTDTETLAVLLARAADPESPLVNILIAPEETGRGAKLAAAGRYFDEESSTEASICKGSEIWPGAPIEVVEIGIRDPAGERVLPAELDACVLAAGRAALDRGARVLAHALVGSKTGLSGPSDAVLESLRALAPDRVDVVVDACQMRISHDRLGVCVQRGWMVQVSGSKSLTGPPFSGGLLIPLAMRGRIEVVARLMTPGIGYSEDWSASWSGRLGRRSSAPAFGGPFRWIPALLEARLLGRIPDTLRARMLDRFRSEVAERLAGRPGFSILPGDEGEAGSYSDQMARHSIVSFQVLGQRPDGSRAALDEEDCRRVFEILNQDARHLIPSASRSQAALLRQEFHIGQPVALGSGPDRRTVMRLVLGIRFFNIIGHAGPGSYAAALESEVSDLIRAIDKLEILVDHWGSYRDDLS